MKDHRHRKKDKIRKVLAVLLAASMILSSTGLQTAAGEIITEKSEQLASEGMISEPEAPPVEAEATRTESETTVETAGEETVETEPEAAVQETMEVEPEISTEIITENEPETTDKNILESETEKTTQEESESSSHETESETQPEETTEATSESETNSTVEEMTETQENETEQTIPAGSLSMRVESVNEQKAGDPAKIRVYYELSSDSEVSSVETRLHVSSKTVTYPQFTDGSFMEQNHNYTLGTDENGSTYIGCSLVPGDSFVQEFQFVETAAKPGEDLTFTVRAEAKGELPSVTEIQQNEVQVIYTAAVPEEQSESETETETETETEEKEPKTYFYYSDSNVAITVIAKPEANLPQNAQLKAVHLPEGSAGYNEAVSMIEAQTSSDEWILDSVCYDIYFEADGKEIEPEEGSVQVSIRACSWK